MSIIDPARITSVSSARSSIQGITNTKVQVEIPRAGVWLVEATMNIVTEGRASGQISLILPSSSVTRSWYARVSGKHYAYVTSLVDVSAKTSIEVHALILGGNPTYGLAAKAALTDNQHKCRCDLQLIMAQGCKCGGI